MSHVKKREKVKPLTSFHSENKREVIAHPREGCRGGCGAFCFL